MSAMFELSISSETLSTDEVVDITGCARRTDQLTWLNRNGWIYHTNKAGMPIIGRMFARMKMAGINPAALATSTQAGGWNMDMSKVR